MSDSPPSRQPLRSAHDFTQGPLPVQARSLWCFTCPECNWQQRILGPADASVAQCSWCGWGEIDAHREGAGIQFECSRHGPVVCLITDPNIDPDDYLDAFCPYCPR